MTNKKLRERIQELLKAADDNSVDLTSGYPRGIPVNFLTDELLALLGKPDVDYANLYIEGASVWGIGKDGEDYCVGHLNIEKYKELLDVK